MQISLIALFCSVTVFFTACLVCYPNEKCIKKRIAKYAKTADIEEIQDQVLIETRKKEKKKKWKELQFASKEFSNYIFTSGIELSPTEFICFWMAFTLAPALFARFLFKSIVTTVALGIIGFSLPPVFVSRARKKREEKFNKQLAEALTVIGNCVKAGFSFQQALESIASEMQPPISSEFSKTLREIKYGISMEDALKHMVDRVKNKDLDLLVCAVLNASQVGGNLSEILDVISVTVLDRIKIKSDVRVLTASGRISGLIIGLLPIILILTLMLINPSYFESFFESKIGKIMLLISVAMEGTGFFVIQKMVDIKY